MRPHFPLCAGQLLGSEAMAITKSAAQHQRLRELFSPMLMDASMSRMLPKIQGTVQRYMREWAARGTVPAYTETLTLICDVLVSGSGAAQECAEPRVTHGRVGVDSTHSAWDDDAVWSAAVAK
jgi:cytochrome P450